jgi:hypothetical protein
VSANPPPVSPWNSGEPKDPAVEQVVATGSAPARPGLVSEYFSILSPFEGVPAPEPGWLQVS